MADSEVIAPPVKATPNEALLGGNPSQWIESLPKGPLKKVAYAALEWIYKAIGKEEPVPGAKKEATNPKDFLSTLKDGSILAKFANVLKPGAIPNVNEGADLPKEKQEENLENFRQFAKEEAGVPESELFDKKEVQSETNQGFSGMLSTLVGLGQKAQQKFSQSGLSMDTLIQMATSEQGKNFFMGLFNRFFKKQPQGVSQSNAGSTTAAAAEPAGNA